VGASIFPKEIFRSSRRWAEESIPNIIHWSHLEKGGHFAAWEVSELYIGEVRTCFAKLR
jgi:epoxide hydrolase